MTDKYMPVSYDFHHELLSMATQKEAIKIHVFNAEGTLDSFSGTVKDVYTQNGEEFLLIGNNDPVRLDKIIVYNGKPGPDYDRLERMDLDCHECK